MNDWTAAVSEDECATVDESVNGDGVVDPGAADPLIAYCEVAFSDGSGVFIGCLFGVIFVPFRPCGDSVAVRIVGSNATGEVVRCSCGAWCDADTGNVDCCVGDVDGDNLFDGVAAGVCGADF